LTKQETHQEMR